MQIRASGSAPPRALCSTSALNLGALTRKLLLQALLEAGPYSQSSVRAWAGDSQRLRGRPSPPSTAESTSAAAGAAIRRERPCRHSNSRASRPPVSWCDSAPGTCGGHKAHVRGETWRRNAKGGVAYLRAVGGARRTLPCSLLEVSLEAAALAVAHDSAVRGQEEGEEVEGARRCESCVRRGDGQKDVRLMRRQ